MQKSSAWTTAFNAKLNNVMNVKIKKQIIAEYFINIFWHKKDVLFAIQSSLLSEIWLSSLLII